MGVHRLSTAVQHFAPSVVNVKPQLADRVAHLVVGFQPLVFDF